MARSDPAQRDSSRDPPGKAARYFVGLVATFLVATAFFLAVIAAGAVLVTGWEPVALTSGSMSPVLRTGDFVIARPHDGIGLGPGTVVVFDDPAGPGTITHRIVAVNPDGTYTTRGDAQARLDSTPLPPEAVHGTAELVIPYVGMPLVWWWQGAWLQLAGLALATVVLAWTSRWGILERYQPEELVLRRYADQPDWVRAARRTPAERLAQLSPRQVDLRPAGAPERSHTAPAPPARRPSPLMPLLVLALLTGATLVALPASGALSPSRAAFADTTGNSSNSFQAAADFCSSPGSQTLYSTADTEVRENVPTTNYGTNTTMTVRTQNRRARSLVQFSLPAAPAGCDLTSATLRLNATGSHAGRTIAVYRNSAAWVETSVTWNTQPGTTGAAATAASATGWVQWTVTNQVLAQYSGSNFGFSIRDNNEATSTRRRQIYETRESSNDPQLVLVWG